MTFEVEVTVPGSGVTVEVSSPGVTVEVSGARGPAGQDGAAGDSAYDIAVANGFEGDEAEWLASLVGPQGSGVITYEDTAALDAVTETESGVVPAPPTTWGAFFGNSALNSYTGEASVRTIAGVRNSFPDLTQTLTIGRHSNGYDVVYSRTKFAGAAWSGWALGVRVPAPTASFDATNKSYVDTRAITVIDWSALDSLSDRALIGYVRDALWNLGTATGLPELDGYYGGELRFENHAGYDPDSPGTWQDGIQIQRVWVPRYSDAALMVIRRHRTQPSDTGVWSAWSSWAVET